MKALEEIRILLVEDDPTSLALTKGVLSGWGYQIVGVTGGNEAISAIKKSDFDAVLMDLKMPELDGFQTTKAIRKELGTNQKIPIIAVTGVLAEGTKQECIEAGMNDYITKPLDPRKLYSTLLNYC